MRVALLTAIAMVAFATNSVLARLALGGGHVDPFAYTGIRILAAAVMLAAIVVARTRGAARPRLLSMGSVAGALAFLAYAPAFAVAYVSVGAGPGALILFASAQAAMVGWAIVKGDRPAALEWLGIGVALAALTYLLMPSLVAPPLVGAALMAIAGLAWGAYCLVGAHSRAPLADTTGNFLRCAPAGILFVVAGVVHLPPDAVGVSLAIASGAVASGLGYIIWYGVLPSLSRVSAAIVQLTVPALAAAGGVVFIDEPLTERLVLASAGILGGVALALVAADRRRRALLRVPDPG